MIETTTAGEGRPMRRTCPALRSGRPPSGASRCGCASRIGDFGCPGTVDRMTTATEAGPTRRASEVLREPPAPVQVAVDPEARRVLICERGERYGYELWFRPATGRGGGPGW